MARRTKEEMLAKFNFIYDVADVLFDIECELGFRKQEDRHLLISREAYLSLVKNKKATFSQCISGIMEAINFSVVLLSDAGEGDLDQMSVLRRA